MTSSPHGRGPREATPARALVRVETSQGAFAAGSSPVRQTAHVRRGDPVTVVVRNAGLVARREYGVRVRSRAFAISTLVLAIVATLAALAPLAIRALDRESVVRIAASAPDERSAS